MFLNYFIFKLKNIEKGRSKCIYFFCNGRNAIPIKTSCNET